MACKPVAKQQGDLVSIKGPHLHTMHWKDVLEQVAGGQNPFPQPLSLLGIPQQQGRALLGAPDISLSEMPGEERELTSHGNAQNPETARFGVKAPGLQPRVALSHVCQGESLLSPVRSAGSVRAVGGLSEMTG